MQKKTMCKNKNTNLYYAKKQCTKWHMVKIIYNEYI